MISEANQQAIEAAGLSFILGMRIPHVPYAVARWRREHPGEQIPDGHILTRPWPAGPNGGRRDQVIYYQYRHDRCTASKLVAWCLTWYFKVLARRLGSTR